MQPREELSEIAEALFRKHLEREIGTVIRFAPISAEASHDDKGRPTFQVTIVYEGEIEEIKAKSEAAARSSAEKVMEELGLHTLPTWVFVPEREYPGYLRRRAQTPPATLRERWSTRMPERQQ